MRFKVDRRLLFSGTGALIAVGLFLGLNIIVSLGITSVRLDLTESKLFTLSPGTRNVLAGLEEPIALKLYVSRKQLSDYPLLANYAVRVRDILLEYESYADGKIDFIAIDPEPFSEEEDQAVADGMRNIPAGGATIQAYFGLAGVNSTDDREVIPFLAPGEEASLEYELTKMIYNLANPERRVVGVISTLPVFGEGSRPEPWSIINVMEEFFEVRNLRLDDEDPEVIDDDNDVLMLIHPKDLSEDLLYQIDQFVLRGGKLLAFLDPLSDFDLTNPTTEQSATLPEVESSLEPLLSNWGVELLEAKVAGDLNAAMRVQHRDQRGLQELEYLPWLRLREANLNQEDFSTSEVKILNLGAAGIIESIDLQEEEDEERGETQNKVTFVPLMFTTESSTMFERDLVIFQRDPNVIRQAYKEEGRKLTLAVRLGGTATSAFPDYAAAGDDTAADEAGEEEDADTGSHRAQGELNAIIVADTDLLQDRFWIRIRRLFDINIPQTIANNGDFVINSLENLSGSTDLISLRSRGEYERPFTRVERLRREAESRFRDEEQRLREKLTETEDRIRQLREEGEGSSQILTPQQAREIEKFKQERLNTRKQLRAVQHNLQKSIESLGRNLKLVNIFLVPILAVLLSIAIHVLRTRRRRTSDT